MKIYKLDVNVAQPINKVVQMQQNSTGVLSIDMSNNGEYIRNLSCQMFDGEVEIPVNDKGFKLDIGNAPKHYMVKATATPVECTEEYIASYTPGTRSFPFNLNVLQLKAGTYRQDEFLPLVDKFGVDSGMAVVIILSAGTGVDPNSIANFSDIRIMKTNTARPLYFMPKKGDALPPDAILSVYQDCVFYNQQHVKTTNKNTVVLSSDTYPAVGYYVDYQTDTLIKPSTNADAFSEETILPTEADFAQLSTDSFTLSGVTYVPTTLSVDGVEYSVLAAVQTPSPEPEEETTEG